MFNKINLLTFLYLILSCLLIAHLKELKEEKELEEVKELLETVKDLQDSLEIKESEELENAPISAVEHFKIKTPPAEEEIELKDLDWDVWCKLQPNGNDCSERGFKKTRFYFDTLLEDCKTFHYGQCSSAHNRFDTITECHEACRDPGVKPLTTSNYTYKILCRLQPSFGIGHEYHPSYYFDINQQTCRGFSYSGKGGNGNRFDNSQQCSATCLRLLEPELAV